MLFMLFGLSTGFRTVLATIGILLIFFALYLIKKLKNEADAEVAKRFLGYITVVVVLAVFFIVLGVF